jgi:DUF917 family protein
MERYHYLDQETIAGTFPMEAGGVNSMIPIVVAAKLGIPLVDCDGMGQYFPNFSKTRTNSSPLGNFSIATDGAPIIAAGRKKSSAAISSGETSLTG